MFCYAFNWYIIYRVGHFLFFSYLYDKDAIFNILHRVILTGGRII